MILKRIAVLPLVKISCAFHAAVGSLLGMVVALGALTGQESEGLWSLGPWALIVFPVMNTVLGLFTGIFLAWGYNLLAQGLGGLEFETEEQ